MTCGGEGCSEEGMYKDESIPWHCPLHRCTKDDCTSGIHDLIKRRCKQHIECESLQCSAPPDWDAHSSFCQTHTCNYGVCSLEAVGANRCRDHSKCGIPNCDRPCFVRPNGRLDTLCDAHLKTRCAKPNCGARKLQPHRPYCLEHSCRMPDCTSERDETGGTLCEGHRCIFDGCFDAVANPDSTESYYCAAHSCREPECILSLQRPSSFCDKHTCRLSTCFQKAASGPGSLCAAHEQTTDGQCRVEGCRFTAGSDGGYCKGKHGCVVRGCHKARLSFRLGPDGDEDMVRCSRHYREELEAARSECETLRTTLERLQQGSSASSVVTDATQRRSRCATVEDYSENDEDEC